MSAAKKEPKGLSDDRKLQLTRGLSVMYEREFGEELSTFRADVILEYFMKHLGASVYNQAVQDARAWLQERVEDLDGDLHEPEERI